MTNRLFAIIALTTLLSAQAAVAGPVQLQVDPAQSTLTVELCMNFGGTECDSDTSPVDGWAEISLDCLADPAGLTMHDFDFLLTQSIDLHLDFGWLFGQFNATGSNIELYYAFPGTPMPQTPVSPGGGFTYLNVPSDATGQLSYTATSLVCIALQAAGYTCNDSIDLATLDLGSLDMENGSISVLGRDLTMDLDIDVSAPLDPNNPDLGAIHVWGGLTANGTVPPPSLPTFLGVLLGNITDPASVWDCDYDGSCQVDGRDIQPYIDDLLTP